MTYIDKNGNRVNVNNCGKVRQEQMIDKGWRVKLSSGYNSMPQDIYDEWKSIYSEVKIYWCGTRIPGLRDYFAMVKD
jgi:hypothetical protein